LTLYISNKVAFFGYYIINECFPFSDTNRHKRRFVFRGDIQQVTKVTERYLSRFVSPNGKHCSNRNYITKTDYEYTAGNYQ